MQDSILREIIVKTAQEKVYNTITDPKNIVAWFPDIVEGNLEIGTYSTFTFTQFNHKAQVYVVDKKPFDYFAYRWVPGGATFEGDVLKSPNTLVEFIIEEVADGTKITVKESGFASLPAEVAENSFKDNSGGWEYMTGRLEKLLNQN